MPVVTLQMKETDGARRLDHFLYGYYKDTPKSHVHRMIRKGLIKVNGARASASLILSTGDEVRLPESRISEKSQVSLSLNRMKQLQASVLQETDDWLIINKCHREPVHAGSGHEYGIIDDLQRLYGTCYLVHRLDRQTSGALVVAKHMRAKIELDRMFKNRQVQKKYRAVISKVPEIVHFDCQLPLIKKYTPDGARAVVDRSGQTAHTVFDVLKAHHYTLLDIDLKTGRFHQIRAHLHALGMPILGDPWYGGERFDVGLMLHAHQLAFEWCGKEVIVRAQWPLKKLEWLMKEGLQ